jgi:hypothetical protein
MKILTLCLVFLMSLSCFSQEGKTDLPYYEIPDYPKEFSAGTMVARMVDALGFRYYWASDSLTEKDLAYRANADGRSSKETMQHIYDLSEIIVNSTLKQPNYRAKEDMSYATMRSKTLNNLKTASDILRASDDVSQYKIIFGDQEIPFWNQVNGPIADAIWHCGQLVIYRRTTDNPINHKVNHFSGTIND